MSRTVLDDLLGQSTIEWNEEQMLTLKRVNVVLLAKVYDKLEQGKAPDEILVDLISLQESKEERLRREMDRRKVEDNRKAQETNRDAAGRGNFAGLQFFKGLEGNAPQPVERPVPKGYRPPRKSTVAANKAAADKAATIADKAAEAGAKAATSSAAKPAAPTPAPKAASKAAAPTAAKPAAEEEEEPTKKKRVVRKGGKKAAGEAAAEDDATGAGLETAGVRRKDITEDTQADLLANLQKRKRLAKIRAMMANGEEVSAEAVALVKAIDAGEPIEDSKLDAQLSKFVELDEEELAEIEAEVQMQMEEMAAPEDEEDPENVPEDLEESTLGTDDTSRPNKGRSATGGTPEDEAAITGDDTKKPAGKPDKPVEKPKPTDEPLEEGTMDEDITKEPSGNPENVPEDEESLGDLDEEDLEKLAAEDEDVEVPGDEDDVSLTESEIQRLEAEMAQEMELADLEESDNEPDLPEETPDDDLPPELLEELTEEEQKWLDEDDHRVDFGAPNEEDPMEMAANDDDDREVVEETVWESEDDSW